MINKTRLIFVIFLFYFMKKNIIHQFNIKYSLRQYRSVIERSIYLLMSRFMSSGQWKYIVTRKGRSDT